MDITETPSTKKPQSLFFRLLTIGALLSSMMMLVTVFAPAPSAEASGPCPSYSIQDVYDDPDGNWDSDQVTNADELYNGLNPCLVDTGEFCAGGGNPLCIYFTYIYIDSYSSQCQASIDAFPLGDYDRDGISNIDEIRNGARPCQQPCPHPTQADLALNPNGSWDRDGISNAVEVSQGTDPCSGITYNPCPSYNYAQVNAMANLDWDNDGVTNAHELLRGTSPCVYNATAPATSVRLPHVSQTNRLPHVSATPNISVVKPATTPVCPRAYPYYHRGNGLCYANPVGHYGSYSAL